MTDLRQAAQQALEALETKGEHHPRVYAAINALRTALAQEHAMHELARLGQEIEQEPVAYLCENGVGHRYFRWKKPSDIYKPIALYTAPPAPPAAQRPWVGLTEFEFAEIYNKWNDTNGSTPWGLNQALEAKLRKLNK